MTHYAKGYEIIFDWDKYKWLWKDDLKPIDSNIRPCKRCGKYENKNGHDACRGTLKNVKFACCGHGADEKNNYIVYNNGDELRGRYFKEYFLKLI
jgi:hypothetical protein